MKSLLVLIFSFCVLSVLSGQQSVGTFLNTQASFNGYTLITSSSYEKTYLINNCGQVVHEWESQYRPGLAAYLLENGNLLRTARIPGSFTGGGVGGRVEMFSWEGNLIWSYDHASPQYHHHHDIAFLPNGNVLIVAWELRTQAEAIAQGRIPSTIGPVGIWPEQIVEVKPVGQTDVEIVWEWHAWDHIVQDFDEDKPNYGVISDHPELIDLNIVTGGGGGGGASTDWIHANSIDYNEELDQIMFSSRTFSEIFVIDHSTTTEEAASHVGGNSNRGGDILFRWGNPANYQRGNNTNQKLYGQHDAHWIPLHLEGGGDIMIFNNGAGRPGGDYSSVDVISPPMNSEGHYTIEPDTPFGPTDLTWNYKATPNNSFFANRVSGAQRLPNGNTLICEGPDGHLFEINEDFNIVWDYISPVTTVGPVPQEANPGNNSLFRAYRYGPDYPAFSDKDLTPKDFLEQNPIDYGCKIFSETSSVDDLSLGLEDIKIVGNPVIDVLQIKNPNTNKLYANIYNLQGQKMNTSRSSSSVIEFDVSSLPPGMYLLNLVDEEHHKYKTLKFVIE